MHLRLYFNGVINSTSTLTVVWDPFQVNLTLLSYNKQFPLHKI